MPGCLHTATNKIHFDLLPASCQMPQSHTSKSRKKEAWSRIPFEILSRPDTLHASFWLTCKLSPNILHVALHRPHKVLCKTDSTMIGEQPWRVITGCDIDIWPWFFSCGFTSTIVFVIRSGCAETNLFNSNNLMIRFLPVTERWDEHKREFSTPEVV